MRVLRELRFASRSLLKAPLFSLGIVVTLALGIGVNATMFGVVDTLFVRTPPGVRDPQRLVRVNYERHFGGAFGTFTGSGNSFPAYVDMRDRVPAFERVAAVYSTGMPLGRGADAVQVNASAVSWEYFPMVGVQPALGRFFSAAEDRIGGDRVAVLTYTFWQSRFGGDPKVIGRALPLGKGTYTVIGVAPQHFNGLDLAATELFVPIRPAAEGDVNTAESIGSRNYQWMSAIAQLKAGVTKEAAAAQATLAFRRGESAGRRQDSTSKVVLAPLQEALGPNTSSDAKVALWIGVVALIVLMIACANVANLMLARGVSRRREMAVRASLGAGRSGLIRTLLSESLVLAGAGGFAALVLANWVAAAARVYLLPKLASDTSLIDGRVVGFTAGAVLVTAVLTGLVPAIQASRTNLVDALKSGGHGTTSGSLTRNALLVTQIAMTLVLLVGAGLFVRSLRNVQGIDLGFDAERVYSVSMNLSGVGQDRLATNQTYLDLIGKFERIPGVEHVAGSMGTPFGWSWSQSIRAEGVDSLPQAKGGGPYYVATTPGFFETVGTKVISGRDFTTSDVAGSGLVAIIGANFAKRLWPTQSAIGRCLYVGSDSTTTCTRIVGVAADAKRGSITETDGLMYYLPFAQSEKPTLNGVFVRARPGAATPALVGALQREVRAVGTLPFASIETIADQAAPQMHSWRLGATAFTAFGLLALVIAATGVFAVLSYSVSQRTKEIGVRVALGAQSGQVVGLVIRQGLRAACIGTVLGAVGAYALGRAIASLLYQVPPTDPMVFAVVVAILFSVAILASYFPASRASRIAPMIALRSE